MGEIENDDSIEPELDKMISKFEKELSDLEFKNMLSD